MKARFRPWAALALATLSLLALSRSAPVAAFEEGPEAVAISPDGTRLYVGDSVRNLVLVIDTAALQKVATVKLAGEDLLLSMAVSPDGSRLYVPHDQVVDVIDTAANQVIAAAQLGTHPGPVAVSPDGRHLYVAFTDFQHLTHPQPLPGGGFEVIDTATQRIVATVALGHETRGLAVSRDGKRIYAATCDCLDLKKADGSLAVIDAATNQALADVMLGGYVERVAVSPDDRWVYVTGPRISVIGAATNQKVAAIGGGDPFDVAISPDGARLYVNPTNSSAIAVIDTAARAQVGTVRVGKLPVFLAASPDGKRVYVVNKVSRTVSVIDTATLQVVATIDLGPPPTGGN